MIFEKLTSDSTLKDFLDEAKKEKKKDYSTLECKVIQKRADKWCKDNGYPIQQRRYWQKITNFILP